MSMRAEGFDRLAAKLEASPGRVESEFRTTMSRIGLDLYGKSIRRAPFEEGDLRAAGDWDLHGAKFSPELEVFYDGPPGYLLVQHEGGWENFMGQYGPKQIENYTTPGTGPKFLEGPFLENKPRYKQAMRSAARKGLRG